MKKYWTQTTDQYLFMYLDTEDRQLKDRIYTNHLAKPFDLMIDGICGRYFRFADVDEREEVRAMCLLKISHRMKKFDRNKGAAFSYMQTLVKNQINDYFLKKVSLSKRIKYLDAEEIVVLGDQQEWYTMDDTLLTDKQSDMERFIGHLTTGITNVSTVLVEQLQSLINGRDDCETGIHEFYHRYFEGSRSAGRREVKILRLEFAEFMRSRRINI